MKCKFQWKSHDISFIRFAVFNGKKEIKEILVLLITRISEILHKPQNSMWTVFIIAVEEQIIPKEKDSNLWHQVTLHINYFTVRWPKEEM